MPDSSGDGAGMDFTRCGVCKMRSAPTVMAIGAFTGIRPIAEIEAFIREKYTIKPIERMG